MENITTLVDHDAGIQKIQFHSFTETPYSASKIGMVMGIWETKPIDGGETLLAWKKVLLSCTKPDNSDIYIFISNFDSLTDSDSWLGPYRNSETSITTLDKRYLKVRCVLIQRGDPQYEYNYQQNPIGPTVSSILIQGVISGTSSKFYTSVIDIGFSPKYLLLTSETDIPEGAIIRYGVSSLDTTNPDKYQFVSINTIERLNKIPVTGQKIKLFIEMSGNSGEPIVVHEFSMMFSGDNQVFINKIHDLPKENYEYVECPDP